MKNIIIDIETKPQADLVDIFTSNIKAPSNIKDQEKIKAAINKKIDGAIKSMSVDTDYADIECIGIKVDNDPAKIVSFEGLVSSLNNKKNTYRLITFNGNRFDIPLLIKQGIKRGAKLPYKELKRGIGKYDNDFHVDLMEVICDGDYKSLDTLLRIYLGVKKTEIDFCDCTGDDLRSHCIEDCENTYKLFKLFEPIIISRARLAIRPETL